MKRIGIVEDDKKLSHELCVFLDNNGYEAISLTQDEFCVEEILKKKLHMLLLDIGLPNTDGQFLLRELRKNSDLPVLMITSKNTELTELTSMTYGADDFVTKPFHLQILLARMEAVLKRVYKATQEEGKLSAGNLIVDTARSMALCDASQVELTKNELKICYCLVKHKNQIVSRDEIINYLWDSEMFVDDNTLTVNVTRLRSKLESIGLPGIIQTKRGQGYVLLCDI